MNISPALRATLPSVIDAVCAEGRMVTSRFEPTPAWQRVLAPHPPADHWLWLEVVNQQVVGWCRLFPTERAGEFELGLGLLAPYRNQGRGKRMVLQAIAWAKSVGGKRIILYTRSDNRQAQHVFACCGFRFTGWQQDHWVEMIYLITPQESPR